MLTPLIFMLTASIVVHKTPAGQLQKAINCLLNSHVDKIYIIDNSPGESLSAIALFSPKIDYRHVENNGFGAGTILPSERLLSRHQMQTTRNIMKIRAAFIL